MKHRLHPDILEATRLTRAGRLTEATALLQRVLRNDMAPDRAIDTIGGTADTPGARTSRTIDVVPETVEVRKQQPPLNSTQALETSVSSRPAGRRKGTTPPHVPEALRGFLEGENRTGFDPGRGGLATPSPAQARDVVPDGGQFVARSYSNQAGSRSYKLYIPSGYRGQALPLVVMLHGCTQSPDDFAAGTRMNALAEEHTCLIAYPAQAASANASKCWNWFRPSDQRRGRGEPSLIAGITSQIMRDYSVDSRRVYVAGLSAGGAAAAIMGVTYPDLYAAVGVHSGLACGAASDLPSAFAAMRQGDAATRCRSSRSASDLGEHRRIVPTIVFHGDQDTTVHPRNGDQVIAQSRATAITGLQTRVQQGQVPGGHAYSRILQVDASGAVLFEQWVIHGAGHSWSGGSPTGSYTDPRGPDAAREMIRFFLEHPHPTAIQRVQSCS